jgi:DNA-binding XRE family transcriptional regulator
MSNLSTNIKHYRELAGLSRKQTAHAIQKKEKTYEAYETGRAEPNIATLIELAKVFGLAGVDQLITGIAKPKPDINARYARLNERDKRIVDAVMGH